MTAIPLTSVPSPRVSPRSLVRHVGTMTRRNLLHVRNDPGMIIDSTIMPLVVALIFLYVFGGAMSGGRENYRQFLMPGIMVQAITFGAAATGLGLNLDFSTGMMDRLRALPVARSAVLGGRVLADSIRLLVGQVIMFGFALLIGFRVTTDPLSAVAAILVVVLFGITLAWISAFIGLSLRNPQTVQSLGFLWIIPLQFGSSLFVPADTMPGWLQAVVNVNPATYTVDTVRALLTGGDVAGPATGFLLWTGALLLIFIPLAVHRYQRRA